MSSSSDNNSFLETPFTSPCATPPQNYQRVSSAIIASIEFAGLEFEFRIPSSLHIRTSQLIDQYLRYLRAAQDNEPKTLLGLVAKFLRFVTEGGREGKQHVLDSEILTTLFVAFE